MSLFHATIYKKKKKKRDVQLKQHSKSYFQSFCELGKSSKYSLRGHFWRPQKE